MKYNISFLLCRIYFLNKKSKKYILDYLAYLQDNNNNDTKTKYL